MLQAKSHHCARISADAWVVGPCDLPAKFIQLGKDGLYHVDDCPAMWWTYADLPKTQRETRPQVVALKYRSPGWSTYVRARATVQRPSPLAVLMRGRGR